MAFRNLVMHSLMASCVCAVLIPDLTLASASHKGSIPGGWRGGGQTSVVGEGGKIVVVGEREEGVVGARGVLHHYLCSKRTV